MKNKNNQKSITIEEYNKRMDKILGSVLPVHEKLIELLNEASKYQIVQSGKKVVRKGGQKNEIRRKKKVG